MRKSGNKLRVTAQLIRAADSSHLWSQTYDRELTDVFKVQDEIAGAVVAALKLKLLPSQAVSNPHRTGNTDAYDQYLLGQQLLRGGVGGRQHAVAALQQAVALDPQFAAAYGFLAAAQMAFADVAGSQAERVAAHKLALANVEKAIALDPGLSRAYLTRAFYRCNVAWDWKGGEEDVERGWALDPYNSEFLGAGFACFRPGRLQEALARDRRLIASDPLSAPAWLFYGLHLMVVPSGIPEARAALQRALDINPDAAWARFLMGFLDLKDGKAESALAHFVRAGLGLGEAGVAMAEHTRGHAQKSQQALDELKAKYGAGLSLQIAQAYAWRGERDLAFAWPERSYAQHDSGLVRLRFDLPFAGLRGDPRFAALVQKLGLPE